MGKKPSGFIWGIAGEGWHATNEHLDLLARDPSVRRLG
jgi:hypothetical protein